MPFADILRLGLADNLTAQQIADMALAEDRARREAQRVGDRQAAVLHAQEAAKLAKLSRERGQ